MGRGLCLRGWPISSQLDLPFSAGRWGRPATLLGMRSARGEGQGARRYIELGLGVGLAM